MSERPINAAALTADWLTDTLRGNGVIGNAAVRGVEVRDLGTGIGLMGEVVRLTLDYEGGDGPRTMIAKFPTADPTNLGVAKMLFFYPREIAFYTQLAQHSPIRTPTLYHAELDMADHGFVLLIEDFAQATPGDQVAGVTPEQTRAAIVAAGKLHGAWWDKVDGEAMAALFDFANPEFCAAVQGGYEGFLPGALENFADCYSEYTKETAQAFAPKSAEVLQTLSSGRRTFVHGDYRADNLMFADEFGDDALAAVDWQISGRGSGLYDIAYLICNSVPQDFRREAEKQLLLDYHNTLLEMGVADYSFDDCWHDYRMAVLCGMFVAIYTAGGMELGNERGVQLARAISRRVDAAVNELAVGDLIPN